MRSLMELSSVSLVPVSVEPGRPEKVCAAAARIQYDCLRISHFDQRRQRPVPPGDRGQL